MDCTNFLLGNDLTEQIQNQDNRAMFLDALSIPSNYEKILKDFSTNVSYTLKGLAANTTEFYSNTSLQIASISTTFADLSSNISTRSADISTAVSDFLANTSSSMDRFLSKILYCVYVSVAFAIIWFAVLLVATIYYYRKWVNAYIKFNYGQSRIFRSSV